MQKYAEVVLDRKGNVVPGASVRVKTTTGTDAVLYSSNGSNQISNPIITDNLGRFAFYAANNRYNLQVSIGGALITTSNDILLEDPMDETPEVIKGGTIKEAALSDVTIDGKEPAYKEVTDNHEERLDALEVSGGIPARVTALEQFKADIEDPSKGASVVASKGLYGPEYASVALARHELTGQNAGIANYLGQDPGVSRLFLAGYDSLTAGAGGTSWNKYFRKIMRGQLGYGGPGLQLFSRDISSTEGASFGTNMSSIVENGQFYTYSIGGYGLYSLAADGSAYLNWKPKAAWTMARFFYLKQPGGGAFLVGTNDLVNEGYTPVDTASSEIELGYIDIPIGKGSAGQTFSTRGGTGLICLFGAIFTNGTVGFLFGNIAKGGRKLSDVAAQDSNIRKQWLTLLKPSHFILNGGANDSGIRTGAQHNADLTAIITDIRAASPDTSITIVQHNHIEGESSTYLAEHAAQKIAVSKSFGTNYMDIRKLLGTYAAANAQQLMLDGVHPSDKANRAISAYTAEALGYSGNSADPGETPYGGGAGPAVIQRSGSLSTKYARILSGAKTAIYTLGLVAGYPSVSFRFTVTCNRRSTVLNKSKLIVVTVGNSITSNAANSATTPTIVHAVTDVVGSLTAGDFTFDAEISAGKCVISITPTSYESEVVVECDFAAPYNTVTGQAVFEN